MTCFCQNGDEAMGNKIEWDKNDILILLGSKNEIEMVIYNMKIFNKINIQIHTFDNTFSNYVLYYSYIKNNILCCMSEISTFKVIYI